MESKSTYISEIQSYSFDLLVVLIISLTFEYDLRDFKLIWIKPLDLREYLVKQRYAKPHFPTAYHLSYLWYDSVAFFESLAWSPQSCQFAGLY